MLFVIVVAGVCLVTPEPRGAFIIRSVETHEQGEETIRELPRLCRKGVKI
jgi:hypothetical protein